MTHLGYIVAAYIASALVLGGMAAWIAIDLRAQKQRLAALDVSRGQSRAP